jgi:hypothetical protein
VKTQGRRRKKEKNLVLFLLLLSNGWVHVWGTISPYLCCEYGNAGLRERVKSLQGPYKTARALISAMFQGSSDHRRSAQE